jgi:penicillin-binding protein 1A
MSVLDPTFDSEARVSESGHLASILKYTAAILVVVLAALLGASFYLYQLSLTLPTVDMASEEFETARTSIVYAADGTVLAEWHGEENRTLVALDEVPQYVSDAIVAIEDERFYEHNGVDLQAIARAFRANTEEGGVAQGGSTITQQLVKIMCTGGERTLTRKIREALLAYQLESNTDKDDVLEAYLNTVYFGHGAYGIESAAQTYFGTPAKNLTLSQAATLAGVLASPGAYSPIDAPGASESRRALVLRRMTELGYIDEADELAASQEPIEIAPPRDTPERAPYFVEYVKQELIDRLGADAVFKGGLRVETSLDPVLQAEAERAVAAHLSDSGDPEAALVAIDHQTGQVVAMVGGRDFEQNQFNLAAQGHRQPGSAFKPFVLVAALEEGVRPEEVFDTSPYTVQVKDGTWNVQNYENEFTEGQLSLRAATNWSVNAVFARLIMKVGAEDVVETAQRMGITSELEPNPAIALGGLSHGVTPLEMASAYGTIAAKGMRTYPTGIVSVSDDRGRLVYRPATKPERAVDEAVAVEASLMLHEVVESGTGVAAKPASAWAAGKTGTTQSYRDAWFVGFAEDVSCAVWVGYREGQVEMTDVHGIAVTGGSYPARVWKTFMDAAVAHSGSPVTPAEGAEAEGSPGGEISDTVLVSVCPDSMQLANKRCPNPVAMYLAPELVPEGTCDRH